MLKSILVIPKKIIVAITVILSVFSMIFLVSPGKIFAPPIPPIYVNGAISSSGDGLTPETAFKTIQEGINAAIAGAIPSGVTIFVASVTPYSYNERLSIPLSTKTIIMEGTGSSKPVINGGANGSAPVINVYHSGGGEPALDKLILRNFAITNGENNEGGGISSTIARLELYNCDIYNNHGKSRGGGIYSYSSSVATLIIDNCNINNNKAASGYYGGGIYFNCSGGTATITNSILNNNQAAEGSDPSGDGAGIYFTGGTLNINNCSIANNVIKPGTLETSYNGIYFAGSTLNATLNWWGSSTGPYNSSLNLTGTGNSIVGTGFVYTDFHPWLAYDPFATSNRTITPDEWVSMDLNMDQLLDHYGATAEGFNKMLYDNILGRIPDEPGQTYWGDQLNNNIFGANFVVEHFIFSDELGAKVAAMTNDEFINFLYGSLFTRVPDTEGYNTWLSYINSGFSKEETLRVFLNNEEWINICKMFNVTP